MNVIEHDAQAIEFETVFGLGFLDGIKKHLATGFTSKIKLSVVAANGNVIGVVWLEVTFCSRQGKSRQCQVRVKGNKERDDKYIPKEKSEKLFVFQYRTSLTTLDIAFTSKDTSCQEQP